MSDNKDEGTLYIKTKPLNIQANGTNKLHLIAFVLTAPGITELIFKPLTKNVNFCCLYVGEILGMRCSCFRSFIS